MTELPPPESEGFQFDWPPEIPFIDLIELVCEGGFGEIYRARQLSMEGQPVCCKILNRRSFSRACELTGTTTAREYLDHRKQRLAREALFTRSLDSRYVPTVHDRGETTVTVHFGDGSTETEKDWPYFIMEWIEGPSLGSFLTDHRPENSGHSGSVPERFDQLSTELQKILLKAFAEIARGLRDAHAQGIVHLDVTPRNVLLKGGREVKVIDWGMACRLTSECRDQASMPSSGAGSPDYMAPEQVTGPEAAIRFSADVYALGGIGYLLLTGEPARQSTAVDRQEKNREMSEQALSPLHHERLDQRLRDSGAPPFWIELVTKCLSQRPEDRYPDASRVVAAIDEYEVAQEEAKQEAEKRAVRSRWVAVAAGLAALLLVSVASGIFWVTDLRHQKEFAEKQAKIEAKGKQEAVLAGLRFALLRVITNAYAQWFKGDRKAAKAGALKALDEIAALAGSNPDDKGCRLMLAYAYATVGEMLAEAYAANILSPEKWEPIAALLERRPLHGEDRRTLEEALGYYDRAVPIFQALQAEGPDPSGDVQEGLVISYKTQGGLLAHLQRFTEALMACDQSIALDSDPVRRAILTILRNQGLIKAAEWEQSKLPWSRPPRPDHAKAVRLAAYLASLKGVSAAAVYNVACAHALAAGAATSAEEQERCASQAVAYLERIAKEGYFRNPAKLQELRADNDLKPLRGRRDFEELCRRAGDK